MYLTRVELSTHLPAKLCGNWCVLYRYC